MKTTKTTTKKAAKPHAKEITAANFDSGPLYVFKKCPTAALRKEADGLAIPPLPNRGYLLLHGDKPGLLVLPCRHDGKGIYSRIIDDEGNHAYGSLDVINGLKRPGVSAEFADLPKLKKMALKQNKAIHVTRRSDKKEFDVALLNDWGAPYVGGIAFDGTKIRLLNMEHPAHYNKKNVQFDPGADISVKQVLAHVEA